MASSSSYFGREESLYSQFPKLNSNIPASSYRNRPLTAKTNQSNQLFLLHSSSSLSDTSFSRSAKKDKTKFYEEAIKMKSIVNFLTSEIALAKSQIHKKNAELMKKEKVIEEVMHETQLTPSQAIDRLKDADNLSRLKNHFRFIKTELLRVRQINEDYKKEIKQSKGTKCKKEIETQGTALIDLVKSYQLCLEDIQSGEKRLMHYKMNAKLFNHQHQTINEYENDIANAKSKTRTQMEEIAKLKEVIIVNDAKMKKKRIEHNSLKSQHDKFSIEKKRRENYYLQKPIYEKKIKALTDQIIEYKKKININDNMIKELRDYHSGTQVKEKKNSKRLKPFDYDSFIKGQSDRKDEIDSRISLLRSLINESQKNAEKSKELIHQYEEYINQSEEERKSKREASEIEEKQNEDDLKIKVDDKEGKEDGEEDKHKTDNEEEEIKEKFNKDDHNDDDDADKIKNESNLESHLSKSQSKSNSSESNDSNKSNKEMFINESDANSNKKLEQNKSKSEDRNESQSEQSKNDEKHSKHNIKEDKQDDKEISNKSIFKQSSREGSEESKLDSKPSLKDDGKKITINPENENENRTKSDKDLKRSVSEKEERKSKTSSKKEEKKERDSNELKSKEKEDEYQLKSELEQDAEEVITNKGDELMGKTPDDKEISKKKITGSNKDIEVNDNEMLKDSESEENCDRDNNSKEKESTSNKKDNADDDTKEQHLLTIEKRENKEDSHMNNNDGIDKDNNKHQEDDNRKNRKESKQDDSKLSQVIEANDKKSKKDTAQDKCHSSSSSESKSNIVNKTEKSKEQSKESKRLNSKESKKSSNDEEKRGKNDDAILIANNSDSFEKQNNQLSQKDNQLRSDSSDEGNKEEQESNNNKDTPKPQEQKGKETESNRDKRERSKEEEVGEEPLPEIGTQEKQRENTNEEKELDASPIIETIEHKDYTNNSQKAEIISQENEINQTQEKIATDKGEEQSNKQNSMDNKIMPLLSQNEEEQNSIKEERLIPKQVIISPSEEKDKENANKEGDKYEKPPQEEIQVNMTSKGMIINYEESNNKDNKTINHKSNEENNNKIIKEYNLISLDTQIQNNEAISEEESEETKRRRPFTESNTKREHEKQKNLTSLSHNNNEISQSPRKRSISFRKAHHSKNTNTEETKGNRNNKANNIFEYIAYSEPTKEGDYPIKNRELPLKVIHTETYQDSTKEKYSSLKFVLQMIFSNSAVVSFSFSDYNKDLANPTDYIVLYSTELLNLINYNNPNNIQLMVSYLTYLYYNLCNQSIEELISLVNSILSSIPDYPKEYQMNLLQELRSSYSIDQIKYITNKLSKEYAAYIDYKAFKRIIKQAQCPINTIFAYLVYIMKSFSDPSQSLYSLCIGNLLTVFNSLNHIDDSKHEEMSKVNDDSSIQMSEEEFIKIVTDFLILLKSKLDYNHTTLRQVIQEHIIEIKEGVSAVDVSAFFEDLKKIHIFINDEITKACLYSKYQLSEDKEMVLLESIEMDLNLLN